MVQKNFDFAYNINIPYRKEINMEHLKRNSGAHEAQEPHTEKECKINDPLHSHPDVDCGHAVDSGPGKGIPKYDGNGGVVTVGDSGPNHDNNQDPENGPGVK